jgi:hypothetical protein
MIYSTTVQNLMMKYVISEATERWQIMANIWGFKICTVHLSYPQICEFYIGQNKESFVFFFTVVEYITICFWNFCLFFLKLWNMILVFS